jgi:type II secretory pathway component PulF
VAHNFPSSLLNAFEAGPDSTPSIPLLRELATMYSQRAYDRVHKQTGMSSPLLIAFVGLLIAMVIISLFMPLVSMVTSLT